MLRSHQRKYVSSDGQLFIYLFASLSVFSPSVCSVLHLNTASIVIICSVSVCEDERKLENSSHRPRYSPHVLEKNSDILLAHKYCSEPRLLAGKSRKHYSIWCRTRHFWQDEYHMFAPMFYQRSTHLFIYLQEHEEAPKAVQKSIPAVLNRAIQSISLFCISCECKGR